MARKRKLRRRIQRRAWKNRLLHPVSWRKNPKKKHGKRKKHRKPGKSGLPGMGYGHLESTRKAPIEDSKAEKQQKRRKREKQKGWNED